MGVVDIRCPVCDRAGTVEKETLGSYRCRECEETFAPEDVAP